MESNLRLYLDILREHGITPTFPITAKTLSKHPSIIEKFSKRDIEFAVHGYKHIDYTKISPDAFSQHTQKAIKIFEKHNIPFSGFRFPYLRWNKKFFHLLNKQFFQWDSSYCILWDVLSDLRFNPKNFRTYRTVLGQYDYRNSNNYLSLPRFLNNTDILQIPLSLPDDDLLFDRLGLKNEKILTQIWEKILRKTYSRGEVCTLQLHPERISFYKETIKSLIQTAKQLQPRVWISSLNQIYTWWKEKNGFTVVLRTKGNNEYEVEANCSPRANLLLRSYHPKKYPFYNGYSLIKERKFWIKSRRRPVLGIPMESPSRLIHFLKNEGFIFEMSEQKEKYSIYLDNFNDFSEKDEMKTLEMIHTSNLPLVRFWRWPDECKSCLSLTGDIDSITLYDFFDR